MKAARDNEKHLEEQLQQQASAARAGESYGARSQDVPLHATGLDTAPFEHNTSPPAYGEDYGTVQKERNGLDTKASVTEDGRVNIRINQRDRRVSQLLATSLNQLQSISEQESVPPPPYIPPSLGGSSDGGVAPPPPMNVVIQIVGSRGDVQPFVALAKVLKDRYGHRVRLATHPNFKDFVLENGIEFFSIGGDPHSLMAFMVKNPGLIPSFGSLRAGDVGKRRKEIAEYLHGCWRSCFEPGDGLGPVDDDLSQKPFVADCIIANPPSFAHIHIAEKLGIPLHIFFTMPYSPTQAFPHPLANIQNSNADENLTNYMSYALVDILIWQGLGEVINRFRKNIGLDDISLMWAPGMLQRLKIPHTYAWSPALIPKPRDWSANLSIAGFFFLDLAKNYGPTPDLKAFLDAGPPPIYIGFGSIVLDDPNGMTELIFEAIRKSGQRALVSKGWGGVGPDELQVGKPDGVFMLGNVPHDWLFKHVSCVVHHGGAGTTSAGITAGRPTLVVPFFGDQPFWGAMVARAGAGPEPIPSRELTSDNLAEGILRCLEPQTQERAQDLATKIAKENGSEVGAQSFHQFLNVDKLRCSVAPSRVAVWVVKRNKVRLRLSAMAACTLAQEGLLDFNELRMFRPREYETDEGPSDPISGGTTALVGTFSAMLLGLADLPGETVNTMKKGAEAKSSKAASDIKGKKREEIGSSTGTAPSKTDSRQSLDVENHRFSNSNLSLSTSPPAEALSLGTGDSNEKSPSDGQPGGPESRLRHPQESRMGGSRSGSSRMLKAAAGTGKGASRVGGTLLKSPMEFSVNMTKGFHNAPKLYGDDTVRKQEKVSGFRSGLTAAGKEFGFGMYDGITGLVTQPAKGAAKEGGLGFLKGFGKGVGGFFFKPGAALFGVPAHTMKGVYKEMQKHFGSSVQTYLIASRTAQGFDEYQQSSEEERQDVVMRWKALQTDPRRANDEDDSSTAVSNERTHNQKARWQPRKEIRHEKRNAERGLKGEDPETVMLAMGDNHRAPSEVLPVAQESTVGAPLPSPAAQATQGHPTVDAALQRGMLSPVAEAQQEAWTPSIDEFEEQALTRALAESAAESHRQQRQHDMYNEELRRAMTESLRS